jgi:carboxylesterase type B
MQTRQDITDQLDTLYATRGAAMLDGKNPDHGTITKLENDLRALDDAEAERVRRDREKADQERKAEARRAVRAISKLEEDRLLAWADAEVATKTLRHAIERILETTKTEGKLYTELAGRADPSLGLEARNRLSARISNELRKAPGCQYRIGNAIEWNGSAGLLCNDDDWRQAESRLLEIPLKALEDTIL